MAGSPLPEFIIVGPQKCATTWLYECLYEHPEVLMPDTDSVHYFDVNYHKGQQWYRNHFSNYNGESVVGEETPTYIRDEEAPKRIAETVPDVKLIFTLRNPIDRAYSHWWHEKSKDKHSFEFREVFENYDLYQNWVIPGLYNRHLMRYGEYFSEEQMKICFLDDLVEDDVAYAQDVFSFLGIDDEYVPSVINQRVNQGRFRAINAQSIYSSIVSKYKQAAPKAAIEAARPIHRKIMERVASETEYEQGMDEEVRRRVEDHFVDDVRKTAEYVGRDLSHWLQHYEI